MRVLGCLPRMTSRWDSLFAERGAVRLHVRRQTAPGSPLVLLHGLGASGLVWQAFARRLNPPWQCLAPDLPGHGESSLPPEGASPVDLERSLASVWKQLGATGSPVIGHSLGALIALRLAAREETQMPAVVLLDPPLDASIENPEVADVYRLRKEPPGALEAYLSVPALAPVFRRARDEVFERYLREPRGAPWAWDLAPTVNVPALVVQADPIAGGVLGDQSAKDFAALLPRGQLIKIDGAAHALHATHGTRVAEAVLHFLSTTNR